MTRGPSPRSPRTAFKQPPLQKNNNKKGKRKRGLVGWLDPAHSVAVPAKVGGDRVERVGGLEDKDCGGTVVEVLVCQQVIPEFLGPLPALFQPLVDRFLGAHGGQASVRDRRPKKRETDAGPRSVPLPGDHSHNVWQSESALQINSGELAGELAGACGQLGHDGPTHASDPRSPLSISIVSLP